MKLNLIADKKNKKRSDNGLKNCICLKYDGDLMFWNMKRMNCYILFDIILKDQSSTSDVSLKQIICHMCHGIRVGGFEV